MILNLKLAQAIKNMQVLYNEGTYDIIKQVNREKMLNWQGNVWFFDWTSDNYYDCWK